MKLFNAICFVAVFVAASPAAVAQDANSDTQKVGGIGAADLNKLLEERLATAQELARLVAEQVENNQSGPGELLAATRLLLDAELARCKSADERITVFKKGLTQARENEKILEQLNKAGVIQKSAALRARTERIQIEIDLKQAIEGRAKGVGTGRKALQGIIQLVDGQKIVKVPPSKETIRPQRAIRVDVFLVEFGAKPGQAAISGQELNGQLTDMVAKLNEQRQKGTITNVKHFELMLLEGKSAKIQLGENRPYTVGMTKGGGFGGGGGGGGGGGAVMRSLAYRNIGTLVRVEKPEVTADGSIDFELTVEDTQMGSAGANLGGEEKEAANIAPGFVTSNLDCWLRIRSGQVVTAEKMTSSSKEGQTQKITLVSASVQ